jgi:hypothetical protein
MGEYMWFLLTFIPGLAFAAHSYVAYRKAIGKPVGQAFVFFRRGLTALVLLELAFFAWLYGHS